MYKTLSSINSFDLFERNGWQYDGETNGGSWDTPSRRRENKAPTCKKKRYIKIL